MSKQTDGAEPLNWKIYEAPRQTESGEWVIVVRKNHQQGEILDEHEFATKEAADEWMLSTMMKEATA